MTTHVRYQRPDDDRWHSAEFDTNAAAGAFIRAWNGPAEVSKETRTDLNHP